MIIASTNNSYGAVARLFHWGIALLIIALLASGLLADVLPKSTNIPIHKALGIIVLALTVGRLAWWAVDRARPAETGHDLRAWTAWITMPLLLALSLIQPLSGWLMSSAAGKPITLFGLATVPPLLQPDKGLAHLLKEIHETSAFILLALLALHIAGAIYHHFVLKDGVMARMVSHPCKPSSEDEPSPEIKPVIKVCCGSCGGKATD
ncbi:MAG: cytochrome b/b6 domain-containing protein [Rhodospirillaceae bacterium]